MKIRLQHLDVEIDGLLVPPAQVACLYQRDPFPGTSRYRLAMRLNTASPFPEFPQVPQGAWFTPDERLARQLFSEVEWLTGTIAIASGLVDLATVTGHSHFLNNVTRWRSDGQDLIVEGIASPVVRGENQAADPDRHDGAGQ